MAKNNPLALEVREYVKAIVGGAIAALALLGGALGDGLSSQESVGIAVAFLTGFAGTFYTPNKAPKGKKAKQQSAVHEGHEHGAVSLDYLGRILITVGIVALLLDLVLTNISGWVYPAAVAIVLGIVLIVFGSTRSRV